MRVIFIEGGSFGTYVLEQTLSQFVVDASVPLAVWTLFGVTLESETLVHELVAGPSQPFSVPVPFSPWAVSVSS